MTHLTQALRTLYFDFPPAILRKAIKKGEPLPFGSGKLEGEREHFVQAAGRSMGAYTIDEREALYGWACGEMKQNEEFKFLRLSENGFGHNPFFLILRFAKQCLREVDRSPQVKFEKLLLWRSLTHLLGEDVFTCAYLAYRDLRLDNERQFFTWKGVLDTDNTRIRKMLTQGMAENHYHLFGSAPIFPLSWISVTNNINHWKPNKEKDKQFDADNLDARLFPDTQHHQSLGESDLVFDTQYSSVLRAYLFSSMEPEFNESAPSQDSSRDSSQDSPEKKSKEKSSNDLLQHHLQTLKRREDIGLFREGIQNILLTLRDTFGMRLKQDLPPPDYALYKGLSTENLNVNLLYAGERGFLYRFFKRIFRGDPSVQKLYNHFHLYLLLKNRFRRELIQNNEGVGFTNFQRYQNRKMNFIPNAFMEKAFVQMALQGVLDNQAVRSLECRITPRDSASANKKMLRNIDQAHLGCNYWEKEPQLEILKEDDFPDGKQKPMDFFYVEHFIKRKGTPQKPDSLSCRHSKRRKGIGKKARALAQLRNKNMYGTNRIHGIDAASSEIGCRPEVFAQAFRYLRNHQVRGRDVISQNRAVPPLKATYHAGEDFLDLCNGLRAIDEAIFFLGLRQGDRIGHALALGLPPREWYLQKKDEVILPLQDLFDNIVWMLGKINDCGFPGFEVLRNELRADFFKYWRILYGYEKSDLVDANITPRLAYHAWKLRGDDPEMYLGDQFKPKEYLSEYKQAGFDHRDPIAEFRKVKFVQQIYSRYHFDTHLREAGQALVTQKITPDYCRALLAIQNRMQKEIAELGIGIETNPTSNVLISSFRRYDKHPITRFFNLGLETEHQKIKDCPQLFVSINTDDQGVFNTSLENEYALMALALEKMVDEDGNRLYNSAQIYDWLDRIRQMGLQQVFRDNP